MLRLNKSKIIISGGSIAGCAMAISLLRAGADVTVLERSSRPLVGRGAGIVMPESFVQKCIELALFDKDIPRLSLNMRPFFRKNISAVGEKEKIWDQPLNAVALNWSDVYQNLRKRIPDTFFQAGEEVCEVTQQDDKCHVSTKSGKEFEADYVIAADGVESVVRMKTFPTIPTEYSGYVAWRGTTAIPSIVANQLFEAQMPCYVFSKGHLLLYRIPSGDGAKNNNEILNWLMYEDRRELPLSALLIDKNGVQHTTSLPPGSFSKQHFEELHRLANLVLPKEIATIICQTEAPFLQPIFDLQVSQYVNNRICFIGASAAVIRPHTGSGIMQAMNDAISLVSMLGKQKLYEWNDAQIKTAEQQITLAIKFGKALVTDAPDWGDMDPDKMGKWWEQINASSWYATTPQLRK